MTTNEPMSEQALTMIRELLADDGRQWGDYSPQELYRVGWSAELLLTEVDRLRAREQALEAENAAMRPIVAAVAEHIGASVSDDFRLCSFCANGAIESRVIYHSDDCEVEQARAFITAHPTDTATAGETESAGGDDE